MHRFSNLFIIISLLTLTSFLGYWIHNAYQEERTALENELQLNLAHQLLRHSNVDFPQLMKKFTSGLNPKNVNVQVYVTKDTLSQKPTLARDSLASPDTVLMENTYQTSWWKTSSEQNASKKSLFLLSDSSSHVLDSIINETQIQQQLEKSQANIPYKAFINILPHISFAIFLLGITIFAIWLSHQYHLQQQEVLENKNQFISNMAHELRTPVTTIGLALEAIQDFSVNQNPDQANDYLRTSRGELKRLSQLIDRVMEIAKPTDQIDFYDKQTIEINSIIREILQNWQPRFSAKKANINLGLSNTPIHLMADELHLKNVIQNLLDNALKYNPNGVTISLESTIENGTSTLTITDNGVGIPKPYQKRIFEQFFRVPTGNIHNVKGHGLGLFYVKKTIEAHGGQVNLKSQSGNGTTITLKIPQSNEGKS